MATFNPSTFAAALQKHLPNAHVSVVHHTAEEREAAWAVLHALNAHWNHAPALGRGILNQNNKEEFLMAAFDPDAFSTTLEKN